MPHSLRIGSRGSQLALWQARHLKQRLNSLGVDAAIEVIHTSGDRILDVPLARIGGKGLFTKEIEEALFARQVDVAIHSLKDVPAHLPQGLLLAAILEREDARDALVAPHPVTLTTLPRRARVGTSSLRRQAQLLARRPDLAVLTLRGNVDTRLRKLQEGQFDAVLLAAAGLRRLQRTEDVQQWIEPEHMCPAVGQGALALECRADDDSTRALLTQLHHEETAAAVTAERALLQRLDAGCQAPVAAFAQGPLHALTMRALVALPDGSRLLQTRGAMDPDESPEQFGSRLAGRLLHLGAGEILAAASASSPEVR